jgi:DNA-binding response OmpR family regulator
LAKQGQDLKMPDANSKKTRKDLNLLIVDDDESIRKLLNLGLMSVGVSKTTLSEDGAEAIKLFSKDMVPFDLVISDITMPKMDGITFMKQVRAMFPGLPFVMLSSKTSTEDFNGAKMAGAEYYFMKPLQLDMFKLKIKAVLDKLIDQ